MVGRTVVVTGATSGIGLETAMALAATGATVVLGAHDRQRGDDARNRVAAATANDNVDVVVSDFSSGAAVKRSVEEIQDRFDSLDVLINNAGVDVGEREVTTDGLELTFAVNYQAPFLLTTGLLELLKANARARVLNVVSSGHKGLEAGASDFYLRASQAVGE